MPPDGNSGPLVGTGAWIVHGVGAAAGVDVGTAGPTSSSALGQSNGENTTINGVFISPHIFFNGDLLTLWRSHDSSLAQPR